jgi:hypothetical protein
MSTGAVKLPFWLRIVVVAGLAMLAAGTSLVAYRWYVRPVTLSIAVGSFDGDAPRIVSALANRLARRQQRAGAAEAGRDRGTD